LNSRWILILASVRPLDALLFQTRLHFPDLKKADANNDDERSAVPLQGQSAVPARERMRVCGLINDVLLLYRWILRVIVSAVRTGLSGGSRLVPV